MKPHNFKTTTADIQNNDRQSDFSIAEIAKISQLLAKQIPATFPYNQTEIPFEPRL